MGPSDGPWVADYFLAASCRRRFVMIVRIEHIEHRAREQVLTFLVELRACVWRYLDVG